AVLALIVFSSALGVIPAFLLKEILNRAIPERDTTLLAYLAGGMIAIAIASGVLGVVQTLLSNQVGQRVMHDLRAAVFRHLQRLSLAFFTRTRTGEVQSRISNDIGGVQHVVTSNAPPIALHRNHDTGPVVRLERAHRRGEDARHARPELAAGAVRVRADPALRVPDPPRRQRA